MNYFDTKTAAERYSKGRPNFHHNIIRHIHDYLQPDKKIDKALDVACGTGLSTEALLEIADCVYGTDSSQEMLNFASRSGRINYLVAPAEGQPFEDNYFDLITVSSGVHWFDIDRFLKEANRLLKNKSWLVLFENHFIAEMENQEDFSNWFSGVYLKNYPSPPRNNEYPWTNENLNPKNFILVKEERFKNTVAFTKKQLALYFTTQSNIISAVQSHQTTYEEVDNWLEKELNLFFYKDDQVRKINFGNWIKFIRKSG